MRGCAGRRCAFLRNWGSMERPVRKKRPTGQGGETTRKNRYALGGLWPPKKQNRGVVANQCAHWCGNPVDLPGVLVGADAERSCSRRRSVTDAACPLRVLIGPQVLVLLGSSTERRCAERRDLSGGRERWDGQRITKILRGQFRTTVRTSPLSFLGRLKPFFSFWQRKKERFQKESGRTLVAHKAQTAPDAAVSGVV